jgi:hypothetical protein
MPARSSSNSWVKVRAGSSLAVFTWVMVGSMRRAAVTPSFKLIIGSTAKSMRRGWRVAVITVAGLRLRASTASMPGGPASTEIASG